MEQKAWTQQQNASLQTNETGNDMMGPTNETENVMGPTNETGNVMGQTNEAGNVMGQTNEAALYIRKRKKKRGGVVHNKETTKFSCSNMS